MAGISARGIVSGWIGAPTKVETDRLTETVGTTAQIIARADQSRVGIVVVNIGTSSITVGFGPEVGAGKGITLVQDGSLGFNLAQDYALPQQEWWGHCSTDDNGIYVVEVLLTAEAIEAPPAG